MFQIQQTSGCQILFVALFFVPHDRSRVRLASSAGWAIDCFKCVSIDGSNKPCDDPFHNNGSRAFLESPCLGGRKGRDGLFPATACLKIAGVYGKSSYRDTILLFLFVFSHLHYVKVNRKSHVCEHIELFLNRLDGLQLDESGETLMVRGCALDSGTLTTDSEIIRMSHCGGFYFDDK